MKASIEEITRDFRRSPENQNYLCGNLNIWIQKLDVRLVSCRCNPLLEQCRGRFMPQAPGSIKENQEVKNMILR
jgi:hypothetical protein